MSVLVFRFGMRYRVSPWCMPIWNRYLRPETPIVNFFQYMAPKPIAQSHQSKTLNEQLYKHVEALRLLYYTEASNKRYFPGAG